VNLSVPQLTTDTANRFCASPYMRFRMGDRTAICVGFEDAPHSLTQYSSNQGDAEMFNRFEA